MPPNQAARQPKYPAARVTSQIRQHAIKKSHASRKNCYFRIVRDESGLAGWVAKGGLAASVAPVWAFAERTNQYRCDSCHFAHTPITYSVNQWPGELDSMADHDGLMGEEMVLVRQYLQTHAKTLLIHRPAVSEESEVEQD